MTTKPSPQPASRHQTFAWTIPHPRLTSNLLSRAIASTYDIPNLGPATKLLVRGHQRKPSNPSEARPSPSPRPWPNLVGPKTADEANWSLRVGAGRISPAVEPLRGNGQPHPVWSQPPLIGQRQWCCLVWESIAARQSSLIHARTKWTMTPLDMPRNLRSAAHLLRWGIAAAVVWDARVSHRDQRVDRSGEKGYPTAAYHHPGLCSAWCRSMATRESESACV